MEVTLDEIKQTIKSAKDSVWVIEDSISKLDNGQSPTTEIFNAIESNTNHLKIVVGRAEVIESKEDISELLQGIELGEAKLAEDIWQTK